MSLLVFLVHGYKCKQNISGLERWNNASLWHLAAFYFEHRKAHLLVEDFCQYAGMCVLHMRVWVRPNWALRLLCVHLHLTVGKCFHSPVCFCHVHMCQTHPALQILSQYKVKYLHVFFFPDVLCTKREESLLNTVPSFFHFHCFPTTISHSLLIRLWKLQKQQK